MNASLGTLWLGALAAFAVVAGVMPLVLRGWRALGRRDDEVSLRKVHTGQIPRAGGLVILLGTGVMLLVGLAGVSSLSATHELFSVSPLTGGLLGALILGLTGAWDDLIGLRPRTKLVMQVVASVIAVLYGLHWSALELLLGLDYLWLSSLLTVVFLVATVNAVNMMDGLDGLAGGIALIGFATVVMSIFAGPVVQPGTLAAGWAAACALGATGGFLVHNRHPAKVFMGDAGSYFLGFLLPVLLLQVEPVRWRVPEIQLSIAILPLMVPLFDMTLAVVRRTLRGQPIFAGDSDHVHHRLMAAGFTHARAVLVLWLSTAMFSALAYLNVIGIGGWWTLLGTLVAVLLAAVLLGYHKMLARLPAFTDEALAGERGQLREHLVIAEQHRGEQHRDQGTEQRPPATDADDVEIGERGEHCRARPQHHHRARVGEARRHQAVVHVIGIAGEDRLAAQRATHDREGHVEQRHHQRQDRDRELDLGHAPAHRLDLQQQHRQQEAEEVAPGIAHEHLGGMPVVY
ncbi:MAG: undecaprenyl/decaprenyl-phosphate alpha-N-acetylglucosaminyl 1-phosphate transferase, partial [Deltaproteobacteria bacterium]|nr:undecaprenyl/decaprenyl-phosphate alpha-N-acetylglucosaminyl 1-phosphate transferase [Nannocystaceae bacterium]